MKPCARLCVSLLVLVVVCPGCGIGGASAHRIRDTEGGHYPLADVHFVEGGQRARGVLVAATEGNSDTGEPLWTTMLVPTGKTSVPGPAWAKEGTVHGQRAHAIATLPDHRSLFNLTRYGDAARARFGQHFVWVLGTKPYVLGLPSAEPQANWRQVATPSNPWPTRLTTDGELNGSVAALVVYPESFWAVGDAGRRVGMKVSLVTLAQPMRVNDVLDALTSGDPFRLGTARTVSLDEQSAPAAARGTSIR